MSASDLPRPRHARGDALVLESHSPEGGRGAHLAPRQARRAAAETIVVHVSRVPALVAAITEVALRLTQSWERHGEQYWERQPAPGGIGPQDPEGAHGPPPRRTPLSDEDRQARGRAKADLLERVPAQATQVLRVFLAAEDDEQAAAALAPLLGTTHAVAQELVRHLQFRELTAPARRQTAEQAELPTQHPRGRASRRDRLAKPALDHGLGGRAPAGVRRPGHLLAPRVQQRRRLAQIVRLYADDDLGSTRGVVSDPPDDSYVEAFRQLDEDPRHRLVVVEDDGELVATLQLSFLPHLVLRGGERAQIEGLRVRTDRRGSGLGEAVFRWAIQEARQRGCRLVQLERRSHGRAPLLPTPRLRGHPRRHEVAPRPGVVALPRTGWQPR